MEFAAGLAGALLTRRFTFQRLWHQHLLCLVRLLRPPHGAIAIGLGWLCLGGFSSFRWSALGGSSVFGS
jgi:hypothetical protein